MDRVHGFHSQPRGPHEPDGPNLTEHRKKTPRHRLRPAPPAVAGRCMRVLSKPATKMMTVCRDPHQGLPVRADKRVGFDASIENRVAEPKRPAPHHQQSDDRRAEEKPLPIPNNLAPPRDRTAAD